MYKDDKDELMIFGRSRGDSSVGIGSISFEIKTGLPNDKDTKEMLESPMVNKRYHNYKEYLLYHIAKLFYELHDNGDILLDTNEKTDEECWDYRLRFGYDDFKKDRCYDEKVFHLNAGEMREIIIEVAAATKEKKEIDVREYADEMLLKLVRR